MQKCGQFFRNLLLLFAFIPTLATAQAWRVGILAQRGVTHTYKTWQPWIDWLNQEFENKEHFSLVTLDLNDLIKDQAQNIDFILTNQAQFFYINNETVRWLVTLKSPRQNLKDNSGRVGSAIFVRQDSPYYQLKDLKHKQLSAVGEQAFGGFLLGYHQLYQQGLIENKDFHLKFTGFPVDNTLLWLQEKKVDAAIVPVCIFEELVKEGAVKAENFRLLAPKSNQLGCLASTELLPNWSLAAMPQVPSELASQLVTNLLNKIPPNLPQWTPPYSTTQADTILRKLYKHPKQNLWETTKYWLIQYKGWIIAIILLLLFNYLWISLQIHRKSKALQQAYQEMRKYEQQLIQADRLSILGEMSTGIAHEINQPLSAIRMYAEGIKYQLHQENSIQKSIEILDKILQQVDKSAEIIRNLMDWAKGKKNEDTELIQLKTLLQRSIQFISLQHSCKIECNCNEQLHIYIKPTLLEQIICNCLLNSVQAKANHIIVNVKQQNAAINIHILDNGTGFQALELKFPFVPFRTSKINGLGLGLVLCQRLIRTINGEISLHNRKEELGAEVILTLPIKEKENVNSFS